MKDLKNVISGFSFASTVQFINIFIGRVFNLGRLEIRYGPCYLNEIQWMEVTIASIVSGLFFGWIVYMIDKAEKARGKETHIPRIKFNNFGVAVLFFTALFFSFIFIFVVREYNVRMGEIEYMLRKTFFQFCCTYNIPWLEISVTSLIFGIILAMGFSMTPQKNKENSKQQPL